MPLAEEPWTNWLLTKVTVSKKHKTADQTIRRFVFRGKNKTYWAKLLASLGVVRKGINRRVSAVSPIVELVLVTELLHFQQGLDKRQG